MVPYFKRGHIDAREACDEQSLLSPRRGDWGFLLNSEFPIRIPNFSVGADALGGPFPRWPPFA